MQIRLIHISLRRSGAQARKERSLEAESLSVGRGTDNGLVLNELTIALHHLTFHARADGGIYVERNDATELLINGQVSTGERVEPGDVVRVGIYELRVQPPAAGENLVLEVEEIERRGDEREELAKRTRLGVEGGWLRRRPLAWSFVVILPVLFLVVPLVTGQCEGAWNSGSISRKHAFIAEECSVCHQGFQRVSNEGCVGCHGSIANHAAEQASSEALDGERCAACHIEHNGERGLAMIEEPLCEDCHADIRELHAKTELPDASDFLRDHPEFRLHILDPSQGEIRPVLWSPDVKETSGVAFSHWRHVGQVVPNPDGENENMRCDACHQTDAGGKYMQPIDYEEHCQACHVLEFDEDFPGEQAIHGDPVKMRQQLRGLYSEKALKGEVAEVKEEAPSFIRFMRPGQELTEEQAQIVYAWVDQQVAAAQEFLTDDLGECARCHTLEAGGASDGGFDVTPVGIANIWMPKGEFLHETHGPFPCRDCHEQAAVYDTEDEEAGQRPAWSVAGAGPHALFTPDELKAYHQKEPSEVSGDVLVPGVARCQTCHGGANASPPQVASPCVLCHPFHREEHGTMRERVARHQGVLQERENVLPPEAPLGVDSAPANEPPEPQAPERLGADG